MYFFDTRVLIDFLKGKLPLGLELLKNSSPHLFKVPAIVEAELLTGAEKSQNPHKNRRAITELLLPFEVVPFCSNCARQYGVIRAALEQQGQRIEHNDLLIAATALAHGAVLITNNVDEFSRVPNLSIESWHECEFS